jgi:hypothetical protein
LTDGSAAHQFHIAFDLSPHEPESPLDAWLTGRRQREKIVTADPNGFGAERQRLENVSSALNAAVHHHVDPVAHCVDYFRKLIECRS